MRRAGSDAFLGAVPAAAATMVLAALAACTTSDAERCQHNREAVESCDRSYDFDVCATKEGRCEVACFAAIRCEEFDQDPSPALSRCLSKCTETERCKDDGRLIRERFLCDGENDCVDGSDERGCRYFSCEDGTVVGADAECDFWADCPDRSDENRCAYCSDYDASLSASELCDGIPICDNGADGGKCL